MNRRELLWAGIGAGAIVGLALYDNQKFHNQQLIKNPADSIDEELDKIHNSPNFWTIARSIDEKKIEVPQNIGNVAVVRSRYSGIQPAIIDIGDNKYNIDDLINVKKYESVPVAKLSLNPQSLTDSNAFESLVGSLYCNLWHKLPEFAEKAKEDGGNVLAVGKLYVTDATKINECKTIISVATNLGIYKTPEQYRKQSN